MPKTSNPIAQEDWLALAKKKKVTDLDALVAALFAARMPEVAPRLAALASHPHRGDPRVVRALTDAVVEPPFASTASKKLWLPLFDLFAEVGDADALARVAPLVDGYDRKVAAVVMGPWMKAKLAALVAALEKRHGPAKTPVAPKPANRAKSTAESLHEDVIAHPEDDEPRAVLADVLQQAGDPRGEFIALQLERARGGRSDVAREGALLTAHRKEWLGPLYDVIAVEHAVFERGFLAVARATGHPASKVAKTAGHPIWATVREIGSSATPALAVITHPTMRALRRVTDLTPKTLYVLLNHATPLPIEEVASRALDGIIARPTKDVIKALGSAPGMPRLKRIDVRRIANDYVDDIPHFDFFWMGALASRLETLAFDTYRMPEWICHLLRSGVATPRRIVVADDFELTASKAGGRLDSLGIRHDRLDDHTIADRVFMVLKALVPGLATAITCEVARIDANAKDAARLAKELTRLRGVR